MKGRRTAAMLCVLLGHALVIFLMANRKPPADRRGPEAPALQFVIVPVDEKLEEQDISPVPPAPSVSLSAPASLTAESGEDAAQTSTAAPGAGYVDWPQEGKQAAARVLAREAEAERLAKLFAGPQGTWASLTKRQQSQFDHFRWKNGVDGLERDENGNTIYHVSDGCVLVNFLMIACAIGKKPPAYGEMFKDMRQYFDEQRRPETQEGNGREPESMRPPKWAKPLGERNP